MNLGLGEVGGLDGTLLLYLCTLPEMNSLGHIMAHFSWEATVSPMSDKKMLKDRFSLMLEVTEGEVGFDCEFRVVACSWGT